MALLNRFVYIFGGIIAACGFPPFFIFPCFLLAVGWLFYKICETKTWNKKVAIDILLFWTAFFSINLYWLAIPLTFDIKQYWFLIPFALFAIPIVLSLYMIPAGYYAWKFRTNIIKSGVAFTIGNFLATIVYGKICPVFPWVLPGYIWNAFDSSMQVLSIWGIYGQTFITFVICSLFGISFAQYKRKKRYISYLLMNFAIISSIFAFGYFRLNSNPTEFTNFKARIVKSNVAQEEKTSSAQRYQLLKTYLGYCEHSGGDFDPRIVNYKDQGHLDFIIWPEASVPYLFRDDFSQLIEKLSRPLLDGEILLTGVVRQDNDDKVFNSVVAIDKDKNIVAKYDKHHLVPFGEYIPFRQFIPSKFEAVANTIGDFDRGTTSNVIELKGLKIIVSICYEAVFSGEIVFDKEGDVIVNITNDSWFGYSSALSQHLQIVRARAVEEGLPLIRATGFGIAAVFDAYGRTIIALDEHRSGVADFYVPKKAQKTLFSRINQIFK